jgi:hypothetical protein
VFTCSVSLGVYPIPCLSISGPGRIGGSGHSRIPFPESNPDMAKQANQQQVEALVAGAEAAAVNRLSAAVQSPQAGDQAPGGVAHAVKQAGIQTAILQGLLARFGPLAARAALGFIAERYGNQIEAFLVDHASQVEAIVGPEQWAAIRSVLSVFLPDNISA